MLKGRGEADNIVADNTIADTTGMHVEGSAVGLVEDITQRIVVRGYQSATIADADGVAEEGRLLVGVAGTQFLGIDIVGDGTLGILILCICLDFLPAGGIGLERILEAEEEGIVAGLPVGKLLVLRFVSVAFST